MKPLNAELHWIHVFKDMVFSGDVARLGPYATTVYLVIKTHSSAAGHAFPSIETIADRAGISEVQVKRQLKTLEAHGYIVKERVGRNNIYQLREKVMIHDADGKGAAMASWDYVPAGVAEAVAELKNVIVTGDLQGAKLVHIERLQININKDVEIALNVQESAGGSAAKRLEEIRRALKEKGVQ